VEAGISTWRRDDGFEISTDKTRVDLDLTHRFLHDESYWAAGVPRDVFERSVAGSMVFGIYNDAGEQVGFARVVSDLATFAWIGDVFVLDAYRGRALGKWLMECITTHPQLQGLRRWMLATRDAHGLYAQYGFTPLHDPTRFMERWDRDVYKR
jgi:GNAT superfamily N-acetyltransferase